MANAKCKNGNSKKEKIKIQQIIKRPKQKEGKIAKRRENRKS